MSEELPMVSNVSKNEQAFINAMDTDNNGFIDAPGMDGSASYSMTQRTPEIYNQPTARDYTYAKKRRLY